MQHNLYDPKTWWDYQKHIEITECKSPHFNMFFECNRYKRFQTFWLTCSKMKKFIFLFICLCGKISSELISLGILGLVLQIVSTISVNWSQISKKDAEDNNFYATELTNLMNFLNTIHNVPSKRSPKKGYFFAVGKAIIGKT